MIHLFGKSDNSDSAPIFVIIITHVLCETHHRCPNYPHLRIENVSAPCYNKEITKGKLNEN